jgi:hypothetical protein
MMSSVGIRVASFRWRLPEASRLDKLKRRFALITRGMNVGQGNKKLLGDFGIEVGDELRAEQIVRRAAAA